MSRLVVLLVAFGVTAGSAVAQDPVKVDSHPATVAIPLTDGVGRFTVSGKTQEQRMVAGTPLWIGPEKRAVENAGKTKVEVIVVESKASK